MKLKTRFKNEVITLWYNQSNKQDKNFIVSWNGYNIEILFNKSFNELGYDVTCTDNSNGVCVCWMTFKTKQTALNEAFKRIEEYIDRTNK